MNVLYISQEIMPFLPETPMSYIARYLPQYMQETGHEIRAFMPKYGTINQRRNQLHEVIRLSGINVIINQSDYPLIIKVSSIQTARMQVYFIDNEEFFSRKLILNDKNGELIKDNDKRSIFFGKGVIETVKELQWEPHIIHCHGWFTFTVPFLIKKIYHKNPLFADAKIVYSFYDDPFKGELNGTIFDILLKEGAKEKEITLLKNPNYDAINEFIFCYSDGIIQGNKDINSSNIFNDNKNEKPFLPYQDKENLNVDNYIKFYSQVLEN